MFGGCTELWSNISAEAEVFAVRQTYGAKADYKSAGREPTDYVNSRLILMWGWSPGDGTFGTGTLAVSQAAPRSRACASSASIRGATRTSRDAGRRAHLHPPVHRHRRADRDGVRDRQRGTARPGVPRPPRAGLRRGAPAARRARRAPRTARTCSGSPDGVRKTPEWAARDHRASRPTRSGGSRIEFATTQARRAPVRLRARAHAPTASSSTAPPTRSPPSPATSASPAATRASATAPPGAAASRACPPGAEPDRRARGLAAARRSPDARQGGRLSRPTSR